MKAYNDIGVSAGASTPNWIINRVVDTLTELQGERTGPLARLLKLWGMAVRTEIYSAFGAGCLAYTGMLLQNIAPHPAAILAMVLYVFAMHTLNRFMDRKTSATIGSFREVTYRAHEKRYIGAALAALSVSLFLSATLGTGPFTLLFTISMLGILYNTPILPFRGRLRRLKDLPGSKNMSVALAWAAVGALLPALIEKHGLSPAMAVAFLFIFAIVFIRSSMSDLLDIQSDRLIGRETIPVVIGEERTRQLLTGIALSTGLVLVLSYLLGWSSSLALVLLICLFYILICFKLYDRRSGLSGGRSGRAFGNHLCHHRHSVAFVAFGLPVLDLIKLKENHRCTGK